MSVLINSIGGNGISLPAISSQFLAINTVMATLTLTPSGGTSPYVFDVYKGTLPVGTTLTTAVDGLSATVTGTPTETKAREAIVFIISDDDGGAIISNAPNFIVSAELNIINFDSAGTVQATKGSPFSYQLENSGGRATFIWAKTTGTYPAGLSISTSGLITGTPTAIESQVLTFTVTDANGATKTTANITINVNNVLSISASSFDVDEEVPTAFSFVAEGGSEPIRFHASDGNVLPEGLVLVQTSVRTAVLVGTVPASAANQTITINVIDANGDTGDTGAITLSPEAISP